MSSIHDLRSEVGYAVLWIRNLNFSGNCGSGSDKASSVRRQKQKILHDTEVMRIRYGYPIQNNFFPFSAVEDPDPVGTKNIYRKQTRNSILDPDLNPEYKSGFGEQKRT